MNLEIQNETILLRWWWKPYADRQSLWGEILIAIYAIAYRPGKFLAWRKFGAFLWNALQIIESFFAWLTGWYIGDGTAISFWHDNWARSYITLAGTVPFKPDNLESHWQKHG